MIDALSLTDAAPRRGFARKGKKNWIRRTDDFVQLINLQGSAWSSGEFYVNFGLWPLALGEPSTVAENKMMFRTRAEDLDASDADALFDTADRLRSLADLRTALIAGSVSGLVSSELRGLLES